MMPPGSTTDTTWTETDTAAFKFDGDSGSTSWEWRVWLVSWSEWTTVEPHVFGQLQLSGASYATVFIFEARCQYRGFIGPTKSITVPIADGTYLS